MRKIKRHQTRKVSELIHERLAQLRVQIAQNRARAIDDGKGKTTTTLPDTPEIRMRKWKERARRYIPDQIKKKIDDALLAAENGEDDLTIDLGNEFLRAAECGDAPMLQMYIDEGFPTTWQDPETGETALHIVAACQGRKSLRVLLEHETCDFLLRDAKGRLASEMAYLYGEDSAIARLLGNKERKQADAQGIKLTRRPLDIKT